MDQFKKIVSFILCLAMILTSLTFSFAETEIGPVELENEEAIEEIAKQEPEEELNEEELPMVLGVNLLGDAPEEVNPTWFDSTSVRRDTLRTKVTGLSKNTPYYIFDNEGHQVGNKLSKDSSTVTLVEGGVYSVTTDDAGKTVKATFTFHLKRDIEFEVTGATYGLIPGESASEAAIIALILKSVTPEAIRANAKLEYMAGSTDLNWESIDYTPKIIEIRQHKFGNNTENTEKVRISFDEATVDGVVYKAKDSNGVTLNIVDPRQEVEIFSAHNGTDDKYYNGKLTSLAAIKSAIGLSVSPASLYDSVQIVYNYNYGYSTTTLADGSELPFGDYGSGKTSKDVDIIVKFPGNDEYKPTSASAILTLSDARHLSELYVSVSAFELPHYDDMSAEDIDAAIWDALYENAITTPEGIGLDDIKFEYKNGSRWYEITSSSESYIGDDSTEKIKISFKGNDEYKPSDTTQELTATIVDCEKSEIALNDNQTFNFYEGKNIDDDAFASLVALLVKTTTLSGLNSDAYELEPSDFKIEYRGRVGLFRDIWCDVKTGPSDALCHYFGYNDLALGLRSSEKVKVTFKGKTLDDGTVYSKSSAQVTLNLEDLRKQTVIGLITTGALTYNYISGTYEYSTTVTAADVFDAIVDANASTPAGLTVAAITNKAVTLKYTLPTEEITSIAEAIEAIEAIAALFTGAKEFPQEGAKNLFDGKSSVFVQINYAGNDDYTPATTTVALQLVDPRQEPTIDFKGESPSFQYSEDQGVTKGGFWSDVVSFSSILCSEVSISYKTGKTPSFTDDGYKLLSYSPSAVTEHKFGTASSEAVKFEFAGNAEYKPKEWELTVYPNDDRLEYQLTQKNPIQFNYYDDGVVERVISSGNLALINEELFNDIVASISPAGITSGGVSIKYYHKNDGFIAGIFVKNEWVDINAAGGIIGSHKFGKATSGVENVRIEIEGNDQFKPYSHVFDVAMVDLRTPAAIAVQESPSIEYFNGQNTPVSKQAIFDAIVIPDSSTPAGIIADDIKIEYASGSSFVVIASGDALDSPFGDAEAVNIRLSYTANHEYQGYTTTVSLALNDPRTASSIRLRYNIVPQIIPGLDGQIPDIVLSYNASPDAFKSDLIDQIAVVEADQILRNISFTADDIVVSPANLSSKLLGLQDVEITYKGSQTYKNAVASFKVYVLPTVATIKVNDQDVVYGTSLGAINLVTTNPVDLDYLCVIAGLDTDIQSFISIYFPESLKAKLRLSYDTGIFTGMVQLLENLAESFGISSEFFKVTKGAVILDFYDMLVSMVGDGKNLSEFIGIISDVAARMPEQITETLPFDMSVVERLIGVLGDFSELLTITIDKTPEDAGLYLVTALSTDKNYIAMDTGHIAILPKVRDVSLEWKQEMGKDGLFANNQLSISQAAVFRWGGYLTAGGVMQTDHIQTAYIGVDYKGRPVVSQTAPTGAGIYDETVSWIGGNYAALPITRTYTINRYPTVIEATSASFVYDGQPHTLEFIAVSNGDNLASYITPLYIGARYVSTGAPIDAGEYLVTFDFDGDDFHASKTVNAKLTITEATPVVTLEAITTTYTGLAVTSGSVSFALASGDAFGGSVSYEYYLTSDCSVTTNAIVNAGTYYMKAFTTAFKNYTAAASEAAKVVILKDQPVLATPQAVTLVYNGKIQKISPASILLSDGTIASEKAIGYTYYQMVGEKLLPMNGWPLNVGEYFVKVSYKGNDNYYPANSPLGDFIITKAALDITIDNKTVYVGEELPEYTFTCTGLANRDKIVLSCAAVETQTQTQYAIFVENAEALSANYSITVNDAFLTVAARPQVYVSSTKKYEASVSGDENAVKIEVKVSNKEAEILPIAEKTINKAIGEDVKTGVVKIDVSGIKADINAVKIPAETVDMIAAAIADKGNDACGFEIVMKNGSVSFDAAAAESIADQMSGKYLVLKLDVDPTNLSSAQKAAVKDIDVVEIIDVYLECSGKRISTFGEGSAVVSLPYELKDGQDASHLTVFYVAADGSTEAIPVLYEDDKIVLATEHFSHYVISLSGECQRNRYCPMHSFSDLDMNAWYHDGIHFCLANDLMHGEPNAIFAPLGSLTRSMVVMMLWNMEGRPQSTLQISFCDVPEDVWYLDAVRWAEEFGVTHGCDGGEFQPDRAVSKEELAVFISNYAALKGKGFVGDWMFNLGYLDAAEVSAWAKEAVMWCDANGVIHGYNNKFNPKGEASRAEAATMFMYFCQVLAK